MTLSKTRILLQHIRNLDSVIYQQLKEFLSSFDASYSVLLLRELKLFIESLISDFEKNGEANAGVEYVVKLTKEPNVIHSIFQNECLMKIMYCIGLRTVERGDTDILTFEITKVLSDKLSLLKNFLITLGECLKKTVLG